MASEMRITAEQVLDASAKTGLKIKDRKYYGEDCGCPLGILYAAEKGFNVANGPPHEGYGQDASRWSHTTYGREFVWGFTHGFDNSPTETAIDAEAIEGLVNGQALRAVLLN